jgi:divalent metal cation (Fe/Co/Zn/Cd) transporter
VLDLGVIALYSVSAVFAGSLTMVAELLRGVLMWSIELFALIVMRWIHRGRTAMFEFGSGRLEQLVNLLIAGGMLAGAVWIALAAVRRVARENRTARRSASRSARSRSASIST